MPESDSQVCNKLPGVRGSVWAPVLRFRSVRGLTAPAGGMWDLGFSGGAAAAAQGQKRLLQAAA